VRIGLKVVSDPLKQQYHGQSAPSNGGLCRFQNWHKGSVCIKN